MSRRFAEGLVSVAHKTHFIATMKLHGMHGNIIDTFFNTLETHQPVLWWRSYKEKDFSNMSPSDIFAWVLSQLKLEGQRHLVQEAGYEFLGEGGFSNLSAAISRTGLTDTNKELAIKQVIEVLGDRVFHYIHNRQQISNEIIAGRANHFLQYFDDSPSARLFDLYHKYYTLLGGDQFEKTPYFFAGQENTEKEIFFLVYSKVDDNNKKNCLELLLNLGVLSIIARDKKDFLEICRVLKGTQLASDFKDRLTQETLCTYSITRKEVEDLLENDLKLDEMSRVTVSSLDTGEAVSPTTSNNAFESEEGDLRSYNYDTDSFESYSDSEGDQEADHSSILTEYDIPEMIEADDEETAIDDIARQLSEKAIKQAQADLQAENEAALRKGVLNPEISQAVTHIDSGAVAPHVIQQQPMQVTVQETAGVVQQQSVAPITKKESQLNIQRTNNDDDVVVIAKQNKRARGPVVKQAPKVPAEHDFSSTLTAPHHASVSPFTPIAETPSSIPLASTVVVPVPATSGTVSRGTAVMSLVSSLFGKAVSPVVNASQSPAQFFEDKEKKLFPIYLELSKAEEKPKKHSEKQAVETFLTELNGMMPIEAFAQVYDRLKDPKLKQQLIKKVFPSFAGNILMRRQDYIQLYDLVLKQDNDHFEEELAPKSPPVALLLAQLGENNFKFFATRESVFDLLELASEHTLMKLDNYVKAQRGRARLGLGAGSLFHLYHQYVDMMTMADLHLKNSSFAEGVASVKEKLNIQATDTEYDIFFRIAESMLSTWSRVVSKIEADRTEEEVFFLQEVQGPRLRSLLKDLLCSCSKVILTHGENLEDACKRLETIAINIPHELSQVVTHEKLLEHVRKYGSTEKHRLFSYYRDLLQQDGQSDYLTMLKGYVVMSHCDAFIAIYNKLQTNLLKQNLIEAVFPSLVSIMLPSQEEYRALYLAIFPKSTDDPNYTEKMDHFNLLLGQLGDNNFTYLSTRQDILSFLSQLDPGIRAGLRFFSKNQLSASRQGRLYYLYAQYYDITSLVANVWPAALEQVTEYDTFINIFNFIKEAHQSGNYSRYVMDDRIYGSLIAPFFECADCINPNRDQLKNLYDLIPESLKTGPGFVEVFINLLQDSKFIDLETKNMFFQSISRPDLMKELRLKSRRKKLEEAAQASDSDSRADSSLKRAKNRRKKEALIVDDQDSSRLTEAAQPSASANSADASPEPEALSQQVFFEKWGIRDNSNAVDRKIASVCFKAIDKLQKQIHVDLAGNLDIRSAADRETLNKFKSTGLVYKITHGDETSKKAETTAEKFTSVLQMLPRNQRRALIDEFFLWPFHVECLMKDKDGFGSIMSATRQLDRELSSYILQKLHLRLFNYVNEQTPNRMMDVVLLCMNDRTRNMFLQTQGCNPLFIRYAYYYKSVQDISQFAKGGSLCRGSFKSEDAYFDEIKAYVLTYSPSRYEEFIHGYGKINAEFSIDRTSVASTDSANSTKSDSSQVEAAVNMAKGALDVVAKKVKNFATPIVTVQHYFDEALRNCHIEGEKSDLYRNYFNVLCKNTDRSSDVNLPLNEKLKQAIDALLPKQQDQRTESEVFFQLYRCVELEQRQLLIQETFSKHSSIILCDDDAVDYLQSNLAQVDQQALERVSTEFSDCIKKRRQNMETAISGIFSNLFDTLADTTGDVKALYAEYVNLFINIDSLVYASLSAFEQGIENVNNKVKNCLNARRYSPNPEIAVFVYVVSTNKLSQYSCRDNTAFIKQILLDSKFLRIILGQYRDENEFNSKKQIMLDAVEKQRISRSDYQSIREKIEGVKNDHEHAEQQRQRAEDALLIPQHIQPSVHDIKTDQQGEGANLRVTLDQIITRLERYQMHLNKQDDLDCSEDDFHSIPDNLFRDYENPINFSHKPDIEGAIFRSFDEQEDEKEFAYGSNLKERKKVAVEELIEEATLIRNTLNQPISEPSSGLSTKLSNFKTNFEEKKDLLSKNCDMGRTLVGVIAILLVLPAVLLAICSRVNKTRATWNFFSSHGSVVSKKVATSCEQLSLPPAVRVRR